VNPDGGCNRLAGDPWRLNRRLATWVWCAALVIGLALAIVFVIRFRYHAWDFRNNLWGPARLLLQGDMPYDPQPLKGLTSEWGVPFHLSIWFPTILGIGLPLALLPLPQAANIWLLLSLLATFATAVLVHRISGPEVSLKGLLPLTLIVGLFAPLYTHLVQGQASLIVLASLFASWMLLEKDRPGWAGLVLSVSWVKPQLILLSWPALVWLAVEKGGFRPAFLGWLAGSLAQTIPLWILEPTWALGYLEALSANPDWLQPNIRSLVVYWTGSEVLGWIVALLGLVAGASWLVYAWRCGERIIVFFWALALTSILSPYTWSYDQVLLLPLLVVAIRRGKRGPRRAVFWIVFLSCQAVYFVLRLQVANDAWYAWYPPILMLLGVWLTYP